jgi:hypothetical protein
VSARHFVVTDDKLQEVWLDNRKTPASGRLPQFWPSVQNAC